jgi:hypothetical protein
VKRLILILVLFGLMSLACVPGVLPDAGANNNPGNLNTPDSGNPGQSINTAMPPTSFAPNPATPVGDSPGPGTPTVPTINQATPTAAP